MKEPETYRLELEQILQRFPGKTILTHTDVANYTGHSRAWLSRNLGITGDITAVGLALKLSRL
ncbi:MAG: hypothetical protein IIY76_10030 [Erysipelotrichaceae bacterium]|nr:hypothetical protein [Erysipelotrichaceae bacterium]